MSVFDRPCDRWRDEEAFMKALARRIEEASILSKQEAGTNVTPDRLSDPREVTRVVVNEKHPHAPECGRPDLAIYYDGGPLERVYGRDLSNPFFIECKMNRMVKEAVQALRYKWRDGSFSIEKYTGDSVAMTEPAFLHEFERGENRKFRDERYLWYLGLGAFRRGTVELPDERLEYPVLTFDEEDHVVFKIPLGEA